MEINLNSVVIVTMSRALDKPFPSSAVENYLALLGYTHCSYLQAVNCLKILKSQQL